MHFDAFLRILSFVMHMAHLFLNCSGVGCGCPMSSKALKMGTISLPLMNPVPFLASCAYDMTASIRNDKYCSVIGGQQGVR